MERRKRNRLVEEFNLGIVGFLLQKLVEMLDSFVLILWLDFQTYSTDKSIKLALNKIK